MAETIYDKGDLARLSVTFKVNGIATDPTAVTATVRAPDGTLTNYAYNPGAIDRDGVGLYHFDITADQSGEWAYKFVGTGTAADVGPGIFYVKPDPTEEAPHLYFSVDSLKETLNLQGQTNIDQRIARALEAASRAIDLSCGQRFYTDTTTRYFTPSSWCTRSLEIGPVVSVSAVTVDTGGDGSYGTAWTEGTDFYLDPVNNPAEGLPYTTLTLRQVSGRTFPNYQRSVKVAGTFGWTTPPMGVIQFTEILAAKLLRRPTDAPFGFVLSGNDLGTITRLARTDPDFELLLGDYVKIRQLVA